MTDKINSFKDIPRDDLVKDQGFDKDQHIDKDDPSILEPHIEDFTTLSGWRAANSLLKLRDQINRKYPHRRKDSDGLIGDERHCHGGTPMTSDHCAWVRDGDVGVVTALDVTNDPQHGCNSNDLAQTLVTSRDPRIKYVISNRKIANSKPLAGHAAWAWRDYNGDDPHTSHLHISVHSNKEGASGYDDTTAWTI